MIWQVNHCLCTYLIIGSCFACDFSICAVCSLHFTFSILHLYLRFAFYFRTLPCWQSVCWERSAGLVLGSLLGLLPWTPCLPSDRNFHFYPIIVITDGSPQCILSRLLETLFSFIVTSKNNINLWWGHLFSKTSHPFEKMPKHLLFS